MVCNQQARYYFYEVEEHILSQHKVCFVAGKLRSKGGLYIEQLNIWVKTAAS